MQDYVRVREPNDQVEPSDFTTKPGDQVERNDLELNQIIKTNLKTTNKQQNIIM